MNRGIDKRLKILSSHIAAMASEKEAALAAVSSADGPTIFDKIIRKEIPANVVYEDDKDPIPADYTCHINIKENLPLLRHRVDAQVAFEFLKATEASSTYYGCGALAFRDISPQAPTHILIIPKIKDGLSGLSKAEERHCEILGYLLYIAKVVAKQEGLVEGFRIVINDGPDGCQSVYHLHIHLIGGRQMNWPPG